MAERFDAKYSTDDAVAIMCGDTAAEDKESDYSEELVCAEVAASTRQEEDKAGSCSDLFLASSHDSSLPSEESSIVDQYSSLSSEESSIDEPDSSLSSEESAMDEPDSSLSSEESAIIDSSSENSDSDSSLEYSPRQKSWVYKICKFESVINRSFKLFMNTL